MRTKTVKRASRVLIEKYYQKLTLDFDTNKRICDEVAIIQSKRLRNKIAGFTTVRPLQFVCASGALSCRIDLSGIIRGFTLMRHMARPARAHAHHCQFSVSLSGLKVVCASIERARVLWRHCSGLWN